MTQRVIYGKDIKISPIIQHTKERLLTLQHKNLKTANYDTENHNLVTRQQSV